MQPTNKQSVNARTERKINKKYLPQRLYWYHEDLDCNQFVAFECK